ncbi:MAG: terminase [Armatimonadota bacterium]|nr:MAG: terminase [Armatimonadota bacterium]
MVFNLTDYWSCSGQPHAEQCRLLELVRSHRRVAATCGRRWGKTWLASAWSLWRVLLGEQVWWVAPSHLLSRAGFEYCLQHIRKLPTAIRKRIVVKRSSPYEIGYADGLLQFLSADNLWQLQARGLDLVTVDEAGEIAELATLVDQYLAPTLIDRAGRLLLIGTPRGGTQSEYYTISTRPEFARLQSASENNPHIDHAELERLKQELPESLYRQELLGEFVDMQGRAFPHVPIDYIERPELSDCVIGLDWGTYSPAAAVLVARQPDGTLYAVAEVYGVDYNAHQFADAVKQMVEQEQASVRRYVLDAACFNRTDGLVSVAERFRERDVNVQPATRDRAGTLVLLRQLLAERKLVISPACKNLLNELRSAEVHPSRDDIVGDDHALDALRYAVAEMRTLPPVRQQPDAWSPEAIRKQALRARRKELSLL